MTDTIPAPTTSVAPPDSAPQWDDLRAEVRCPLCEYDLRGLTEPRCPECGYRSEWRDLLDPNRGRHPYLFEHHPSRNVWSFARTIAATMLPRRFWRSVHPAQPLVPGRLAAYATAVVLLAALAPASRLLEAFTAFRFGRPSSAAGWQVFAPTWRVFTSTARDALTMAWAVSGTRNLLLALGCYAAWAASTFGALLVFRVSMRRARIRPAHVGRCVVYSFDAVVWPAALCVAALAATVAVDRSGSGIPYFLLVNAVEVACLLLVPAVPYRLWTAYRLYLRFDRPLLTVLASQVIALLVLLNLYFCVMTWGVS